MPLLIVKITKEHFIFSFNSGEESVVNSISIKSIDKYLIKKVNDQINNS